MRCHIGNARSPTPSNCFFGSRLLSSSNASRCFALLFWVMLFRSIEIWISLLVLFACIHRKSKSKSSIRCLLPLVVFREPYHPFLARVLCHQRLNLLFGAERKHLAELGKGVLLVPDRSFIFVYDLKNLKLFPTDVKRHDNQMLSKKRESVSIRIPTIV